MGLFCLVQLVIIPTPRMLPVVELVEGIAKYPGYLISGWVEPIELSLNRVQLRVVSVRQRFLIDRGQRVPSFVIMW